MPLLLGSYAPDMMSKWFVYGIHIGGWDLKASDPVQFHRGWPGVGFTHSLLYGVVWALIFWRIFGSRTWAISFLIGTWAHAITDTGDTVGTMLFFPWTVHIHLGAWAYAGQTGRLTDAAAYFSGPGAVWDLVWIVLGLWSWRVLTRSYFEEHVFPADAFWSKANKYIPVAGYSSCIASRSSTARAAGSRGACGRTSSTTTRTTSPGAARTGFMPRTRRR